MARAQAVSVVTSSLFGGLRGTFFDDNTTTGRVEIAAAAVKIDLNHPIKKIVVRYGFLIDGISVTYNLTDGTSPTIDHGTTTNTGNRNLNHDTIEISADEDIITVFGRAGNHPTFGERVCMIGFVIYNHANGTTRLEGPYGGKDGIHGKAYRATAHGAIIAFEGYAENSTSSVGSDQNIGLFSLMFTEADHRRV